MSGKSLKMKAPLLGYSERQSYFPLGRELGCPCPVPPAPRDQGEPSAFRRLSHPWAGPHFSVTMPAPPTSHPLSQPGLSAGRGLLTKPAAARGEHRSLGRRKRGGGRPGAPDTCFPCRSQTGDPAHVGKKCKWKLLKKSFWAPGSSPG